MKKNTVPALSDDEFVELEDLLAGLPEDCGAMSSDEADGYLTGLLLSPEEILPERWMPWIVSAEGKEPQNADEDSLYRLESLLFNRYKEIDHRLSTRTPIDPIILIDDEEPDAGDSLAPFAVGFLRSMELFPALGAVQNKAVGGAVLGILRHLPPGLQGDLAETIQGLDSDSPLSTPEESLDDLVACVAEIAEVTRGFTIKE